MNSAELRELLVHPTGKDVDEWPVLIWVNERGWQTVKGVLFDEDRMIIELMPYNPFPEAQHG